MRAFAQAVGGLLARMISPDLPTDPYGEIPVEDYVEEPEEPEEEEDPLMQVYSPDEAETTWIPWSWVRVNFSGFGLYVISETPPTCLALVSTVADLDVAYQQTLHQIPAVSGKVLSLGGLFQGEFCRVDM